jgi:hypothetical protein
VRAEKSPAKRGILNQLVGLHSRELFAHGRFDLATFAQGWNVYPALFIEHHVTCLLLCFCS